MFRQTHPHSGQTGLPDSPGNLCERNSECNGNRRRPRRIARLMPAGKTPVDQRPLSVFMIDQFKGTSVDIAAFVDNLNR